MSPFVSSPTAAHGRHGQRLPAEPYPDDGRSLHRLVYQTWNEPPSRVASTGTVREKSYTHFREEMLPFHPSWDGMAGNPCAVTEDGVHLTGYG